MKMVKRRTIINGNSFGSFADGLVTRPIQISITAIPPINIPQKNENSVAVNAVTVTSIIESIRKERPALTIFLFIHCPINQLVSPAPWRIISGVSPISDITELTS